MWFLLLTMAQGGWNLDIETRCMQEAVDAREVRILQQQLDDGWPESVQEQVLLLVWRHFITRQYIILKMHHKQTRRGVSRQ